MPYKSKSIWAAQGSSEQKAFLGGTKEVTDPTTVDADDLAAQIDAACNSLEAEGYVVISILPIIQGVHGTVYSQGGYGYSRTGGAVITGRK